MHENNKILQVHYISIQQIPVVPSVHIHLQVSTSHTYIST